MDFGRSYIKWVRGDDGTEAKVSRKIFTPVPETEADLNLWWYPIEGVQIRVGYDFIALYNMFYDKQEVASTGTYTPPASFIPGVTTAAQGSQPGVPILGLGNFNFQSLNTPIGHDIRFIQGLHVGIGFIF
jgi:hypothetical protein